MQPPAPRRGPAAWRSPFTSSAGAACTKKSKFFRALSENTSRERPLTARAVYPGLDARDGRLRDSMNRDETLAIVEELFASWYPSLLRYTWRMIGDIELAEDLVQETLLLLCKELRSGAKIASPRAWTLTVVRRQVSKHLRVVKDRGVVLESLDEPGAVWPPAALRVDPDFDAGVEWDEVTKMFSVLTSREEEVLLLRVQALTLREIGEHLGMKPQSVHVLLTRALRKLQEAAGAGSQPPSRTRERTHDLSKAPR